MYAFVLSIILFFYIVVKGFDSSVKPVLSKMTKSAILLPKDLIHFWIVITQVLFPLNSVLAARKSNFALRESLTVMATFLGLILGMVSEIAP